MIFQTNRFTIRALTLSDLDPFHDMQGNANVMRYVKPTMNREESLTELKRFIGYYTNEDIYFNIWAIEEKSNAEFVGICGVYENDLSEYEIAYRLRETYWRKGIGTEVSEGLVRYCFQHTTLTELTAYVRLGNVGSIQILEKEMTLVKEFYSEKGQSTESQYKLKKEHWLAKRYNNIEKVAVSDASILTDLTIRSKSHWKYGDGQIQKWLPELTISEEYIKRHVLYKLMEDGVVKGYYSLIRESDHVIKMDNLFVEPDAIGHGYGSLLLEHALNIGKSLGGQKMTLDADPHAEAFYASQGFEVVGQLPTSIEGRYLPIMKRSLDI